MKQEHDEQPKEAGSSPGHVDGDNTSKKVEDLHQVIYGHKERNYPGLKNDVERHEREINDLKKGILAKILNRTNLVAIIAVGWILYQIGRDIVVPMILHFFPK